MTVPPCGFDSWDSDGNLIIRRHGIRIAMGLAAIAASAYWLFSYISENAERKLHPSWPSGFPSSLWATILWVALPLVPFLVSQVLLSSRSQEAIAAGAGIAAALFLCSLLFSVAALLGFALAFFPTPYTLPIAVSDLMFLTCSVWITVSAFRIAYKAGWGLFFLAMAATLIAMTLAYHSLGGH